MTTFLIAVNKKREITMMAMDTDPVGVEEHFIAGVYNTLPRKLQDLIPRASNLLLSAS